MYICIKYQYLGKRGSVPFLKDISMHGELTLYEFQYLNLVRDGGFFKGVLQGAFLATYGTPTGDPSHIEAKCGKTGQW